EEKFTFVETAPDCGCLAWVWKSQVAEFRNSKYFKTLANAGLAVARLEEWLSHRKSEKGPRKDAEDRARMEIPLFLFLEIEKHAVR
ncbi:MAG: hypothetical protein UY07_C0001G0001, partial [Parcubacteria group bacterium GW2011_GWA1_47_8]